MRIQNIQFTNPKINFKNDNKFQVKEPKTSYIQEGFKTAVIWLGFGLGFDVVFKNSPIQNSLLIAHLQF